MDIVVDIVDNHFNPRLREGGDFSSLSSVDGETISIHASAKEATSMIALDKLLSIFQSTPPRRRRQWTDCLYSSGQRFQSTPPRRRRHFIPLNGESTPLISIHASAKEATTVSSFSGVTEYFNPRLREGGDKEYHRNNGGKKNFNPRLREGGDGIQRHNRLEESKISIHASAKEATDDTTTVCRSHEDFNPRLREGGD